MARSEWCWGIGGYGHYSRLGTPGIADKSPWLTCCSNGGIFGFVMGDKQIGGMWVIAVLNDFENQVVGRSLMRLVEDWLVSEEYDELWLTTDPDESLTCPGAAPWHGNAFIVESPQSRQRSCLSQQSSLS